jgi:NADH-quinone oxidoreductase subunit M
MSSGFPWVMVVGLIPLVGVVGIITLPRAQEVQARGIALVASLLTFAASVGMAVDYKVHGPRFQFTQDYTWIKAFGAHYALGADGIALALILMTTVLTPVCVLASWHDADRPVPGPDGEGDGVYAGRGPRLFFSLLLATEALVIGVFGSLDVFFFYVLFEAMLIPMYFLIGSFGGARRSYAAV